MSADKYMYPSLFSLQMEAIVYVDNNRKINDIQIEQFSIECRKIKTKTNYSVVTS